MSDLGNWKATGVTYVGRLDGELFDGDAMEVIGREGQTQIVCDDVEPERTATIVSVPRDNHTALGHYECSECGKTVSAHDRWCKGCGAKFTKEEEA